MRIGIDVGGTKIAAGLVNQSGQILHRFSTRAHSQQQPEYVIEAIEHAYQVLLQMGQIETAAMTTGY